MRTKSIVYCFVVLSIVSLAREASAQSPWQLTIEDSKITGQFDYILHYNSSDSSQVISKVSLPQNQNMVMLKGTYHFPQDIFMRLQYGSTGLSNKGKGSDSDWTIKGSDQLTYYGDMDSFGKQSTFSIDVGKTWIDNNRLKLDLFAGYSQQKSTNELKNVIYHLVDGVEIGNKSQADNGSSLNLELRGIHGGTSTTIIITQKLTFSLGILLTVWEAEANGSWNNHSPAWKWVNSGYALGYNADVIIKYFLTPSLSAGVGYDYRYIKADDCNEVLNGSAIGQAVDLRYLTKGFTLTLDYRF